MLKDAKKDIKGATVVSSGSGNVSIYAVQKCQQLGAKVVAVSDSNGYIYDPNGINLKTVQRLKEVERKRISEYVKENPGAKYTEGCDGIWTVKCDIALPNATQNEIDEKSAKKLVENGVWAVAEGANMPSTPEAIKVFLKNKVAFGPAKAANAGGVAVSGLEMAQNSQRLAWSFAEVDKYLDERIMQHIYKQAKAAAEEYGQPGNLVVGANIAGFEKVARAMYAQGIV
jgi:glutamate dehydrogenase (NADP+)